MREKVPPGNLVHSEAVERQFDQQLSYYTKSAHIGCSEQEGRHGIPKHQKQQRPLAAEITLKESSPRKHT